MPTEIRLYVTALTGVAVAAAVTLLSAMSGELDVAALVVLAVVTAIAEVVPVRFVHAGQTQGFTLQSGAVVALLLGGFAHLTPALVIILGAIVHAARSRNAIKTLFNAARSGVESSIAVGVFLWLAPQDPSPTDPQSLVAMVAAVAAFEVASVVLTTELMARLNSRDRRETFRIVRGLWGVNILGNLAYGVVLATVMTVEVWVGALTGLMMLVMYLGYRGYAAALEGERRAQALNRMTHHLLDLPGAGDDVGDVLAKLMEVFGAHRSVLVVESGGRVREYRLDDDHMRARTLTSAPRTGLMAAAMAAGRGIVAGDDGGAEEVAAPISRKGEPVGALMMAGRRGIEPWGEADASLLAAVANELAVALDNVALLNQVEEERARLEAESTKLNDILTAASDGIVSVRADGTIESWNRGMARISGVAADVAIGQPWHAVLRLKDDADTEFAPTGDHLVARAMAGDHPGPPLSLQVLRADGVWRRMQCTVSPVRNHDGTHRGVVLVARDVTTERELEDLKSDFIATVSHELRTPLTPLKGFLSTLRNPRTTLTPDQLASVHGAMGSQLTRLETLIADLLAVAELDHGQFDLRPEPLDLSEIVADAVAVEAADELSRCTMRIEDGVTAVADHVALVRVVRSLVSNALKHTQGQIEVAVRAHDDDVQVEVRDDGPGIAPWDQQRVFNRFERLGNHLTRTQGPGLGLTIARSLALRMGGDVTLASDVGVGATFTLRLPRARPRSVPLRAASEA